MADIQILLNETLLSVVRESVGSNMFRHLYAVTGGEKKDILDDGDLACAFYVSSILSMFGLLESQHATVNGLVKDLEQSGWKKVEELQEGAVIIWEEQAQAHDEEHRHAGIYVGNDRAVSNSFEKKVPKEHHWTYNDTRGVEAIYWNDKLG